jgi:integrase
MKNLDIVETWLQNVALSHSDSQGTSYVYRMHLTSFCQFIEATPQEIIDEYEKSDEKAFKRKFAEYLRAWIGTLSKTNASGTVHVAIGAVRSFFKYNDLPLAFVPQIKAHVSYHNRDISKEEIKAVIDMSAPRERAFYAMMVQSGLRPDTLCKLRLKNLEPDFSKNVIPCKITVNEQDTKGKTHAYFSFIGSEAVEYLRAYLATRSSVKGEDYVFTAMGLNMPFNPKTPSNEFRLALRKLHEKGIVKYEVRGNRKPSELRLYNLRKYFKKYASAMGSEESEFLMGHSQGVRDHYLAQDPEHFRKLYTEKALPNLRLSSATALEYEKTMTEKDLKIATLEKDISDLRRLVLDQNQTLKQLIERVKKQEAQ